ncbi:MAG: hypothetical protein ACRDS9_05015 [Pseudonocardiaceae bacterium]
MNEPTGSETDDQKPEGEARNSSKRKQLRHDSSNDLWYAGSEVHRRVSVKGSGGVTATVVVVTRRGKVHMSIIPPFTWEAILNPGKMDELMQVLGQAKQDAAQNITERRYPKHDKT